MDKIQATQEEIKSLMTGLEGLEQGSAEFKTALDSVEAKQAELVSLQADADRYATLQTSLSGFQKPKTSQSSLTVQGAPTTVKMGFTNDPKFGFKSGGDFLQSVVKHGKNPSQDERLMGLAALQTSGTHTSINDGLMIPSEFAEGLLINESGITDDWVSKMGIESTSSNSKTFKRSAANTTGGTTGIVASRIAENTQMTPSREKFEITTLPLAKLYAYSEVTEEDLSDVAWLEGHLQKQAPKVIRAKFAGELLNGTGVGEAQGMFNANNSNKIAVTRNTATNVKAEDIAAMYARAIIGPGAFWLINRDVMAKLPLMTVGDVPITWESYFKDGMIGFLNGLPVYQSEDCEALGTQGDVRLINPEGYRVLEKVGGEQFASSIHVKFDYDLTAFRWTHRINGISWSNAVYTPRKGATLSPFVELN